MGISAIWAQIAPLRFRVKISVGSTAFALIQYNGNQRNLGPRDAPLGFGLKYLSAQPRSPLSNIMGISAIWAHAMRP
ncbi:hypothetical protein VB715_14440 [Crocosphaera sp. UHCC 0190]|uniref:hypothetical protein n=1 Tax=Crocosphaera sp. UHCC 0190 TaxID=3110246 RepID=UPI002B1F8174|nr:hypothetical protein [Crocosphaera sp. UHCC 0190]MEA5510969.1 hypothetical protein [Crocosphaera sp. UHCC 0190]